MATRSKDAGCKCQVGPWFSPALLLAAAAAEAAVGPVPPLRHTFAATLEQKVFQTGFDVETATGAVVADEARLALLVMRHTHDGRQVATLSRFNGSSQGRYEVQPFFDEDVCFRFSSPGGARAWLANLEGEVLGGITEELRHLAIQGPMLRFDGRDCRAYSCERREGLRNTSYSFCMGSDGEVLSVNQTITTIAGQTPISFRTEILLLNYTAVIDPSVLLPPRNGCVDLSGGPSRPDEELVNDPKRVAEADQAANGAWRAGPNTVFDGVTVGQAKRTKLGTRMRALRLPLGPVAGALQKVIAPLPESFDARQKWLSCGSIGFVRSQGSCGSCWAFAAAEALADRACIAGGEKNLTLAVEYMVDCDRMDDGCNGGSLDDAWRFLRDTGVPTEQCVPYEHCPYPGTPSCEKPGWQLTQAAAASLGNRQAEGETCPRRCSDGAALALVRAASAYAVAKPGDAVAMQREILERGPIEVGFFVFSDFMTYKNGTYFRTPAAAGPDGGHAVRILGWGVDAGAIPYWLVANSWGPEWGMGGFFHIRRGTNECGIETTPAAGEYAKPKLHVVV